MFGDDKYISGHREGLSGAAARTGNGNKKKKGKLRKYREIEEIMRKWRIHKERGNKK